MSEGNEENLPYADFELWGLAENSDGKSCALHPCCGAQVIVGDVIVLRKTIILDDEGQSECIAGILCRQNCESCIVGYVESPTDNWRPIIDHIDHHAIIISITDDIGKCCFLNY